MRDEANESTRSIAWRAHAARSSNPHVGTSDEVTSAEARASDSAVLRQEPAGSVGGDEEDLAPDSRCASESTPAASPGTSSTPNVLAGPMESEGEGQNLEKNARESHVRDLTTCVDSRLGTRCSAG